MNLPTLSPARQLHYLLLGAGIDVRVHGATGVVATLVDAGEGQQEIFVAGTGSQERVVQVLSQAGYQFEVAHDRLRVLLTQPGNEEPLLSFELPIRLPTLNPMVRTHWTRRRKQTEELAWHVAAALPAAVRPAAPLVNIEIEVDRFSTQEPDHENLKASVKGLMDVLQPLHAKRRPYGMGVILEDATWCLRDLRVRHVTSRKPVTRVRIYSSPKAAITRTAACT